MDKLRGYLPLAALAILMMALGAGCSDDDSPVAPGNGGGLGNGATLRAVHASPDAPAVDIYVEGISTPVATNVNYGATTPYLDVAPGDYNIQLRPAGASPTSAPVYETGTLTIARDARITAVAMGSLASTSQDDRFRINVYAENFDTPGSSNAIVRIIHASPDAPTVGIDVGDDGSLDVPSLGRFAETGAAGVELPANTALQVAVASLSPTSRVTAFTTPPLPAGAELFVIATGFLNDKLPRESDGFSLLAVAPTGSVGFVKQNPVVFALHGSPDAPTVDIFAGNAELVSDLSFGELSGAIQVPPGSYTLDFKDQSGTTAASVMTPALAAGERYLAMANGFVTPENAAPAFELLPFVDAFDTDAPGARLNVIHGSADAPAVDVGTASGGTITPIPDFSDLAYTEQSPGAGTTVPAATLNVGVAAAGSTNAIVTFTVPVSGGTRAFAIAGGSFLGDGQSFRLFVVDTSTFPWGVAEVQPD